MLTDHDLDRLPDEPELAFIRLVGLLNDTLEDRQGYAWTVAAHEYVQTVLAFADEHQIPLAAERDYPADSEAFSDWFFDFKNAVTYAQNRFRFRVRAGVPLGVATVKLNDQYRGEIHDLLNRVRKVVGNLQISQKKRDAIYTRIAALEIEVDKDRTRLDAVMDLILEGSSTLGEAAENLEPAVKMLERLKGIFAQAKAESDPPALPSPDGEGVAKRITGPAQTKPAANPTPNSTDLDDEIPF